MEWTGVSNIGLGDRAFHKDHADCTNAETFHPTAHVVATALLTHRHYLTTGSWGFRIKLGSTNIKPKILQCKYDHIYVFFVSWTAFPANVAGQHICFIFGIEHLPWSQSGWSTELSLKKTYDWSQTRRHELHLSIVIIAVFSSLIIQVLLVLENDTSTNPIYHQPPHHYGPTLLLLPQAGDGRPHGGSWARAEGPAATGHGPAVG